MSRVIYVNGTYQPYHQARLHVEDRATQFADSVYEVIEVKDGHQVDQQGHFDRLARSMRELKIQPHFTMRSLGLITREVVRRNLVHNGYVYLQISRGCAARDFIFPDPERTPVSLIVLGRIKNRKNLDEKAKNGIKVITLPDTRWARPDIKTTNLIASVLARQSAKENGADEAWLYNQHDVITEGAASNAWIINNQNQLITHPADHQILKGITREGVIRAAKAVNLTYIERPFTIEEAKTAQEAFISAATNLVMPVVKIDDTTINKGNPGPITAKLRLIFHEFALLSL